MLMTELPVANRTGPELRVRRIRWNASEHTPKYWCSGEPYFTSVMNALSCLFPGGERFFIASVQKFHSQIREPQLKNNLKLFCGQESLHGQQYGKFNHWLARQGYPVEHWERRFESQLQWRAQFYGSQVCVSLTAALEHMTAVLGNAVLSNPLVQQAFHKDFRPLVIWHAIEEIEHKAVAFDVLRAVNSNYALRMAGFVLAIVELSLNFMVLFFAFLRHDRQTRNLRSLLRLLHLCATSGFLTQAIWNLIQYVRPNFHPWQMNDSELIEKFESEISEYLTPESLIA